MWRLQRSELRPHSGVLARAWFEESQVSCCPSSLPLPSSTYRNHDKEGAVRNYISIFMFKMGLYKHIRQISALH
jgi:hypothetical protein